MDRDRKHAKVLFTKLVSRLKKRYATARAEILAGRAELLAERQSLENEREQFAAERRQFQKDTEQYKLRLTEAWNLIADGQRRLIHDRTAVEQTLAAQQIALESRTAELATHETDSKAACDALHARKAELQTEISGLETRAFHLQLAIQELTTRKSTATVDAAMDPHRVMVNDGGDATAPVPLDPRQDWSFEQLLREVTQQEKALATERQQLGRAKNELQKLANELADQRSVLAEQFAKLAAAKDVWHHNETTTVKELEDLARALNARERLILAREKTTRATEATLVDRTRELNAFRLKLESWQAGLTAHESQWYAAKDALQLELHHKREHLATCEAALKELARQWAEAWKTERDAVKAAYTTATQDTLATLDELRACHKDLQTLAQKATAVATAQFSVEAARQELLGTNPKAEKVLRVMAKGWDRHYRTFTRTLSAQEKSATKAADTLKTRQAQLQTTLATYSDKAAKTVETRKTQDWALWNQTKVDGEHAATLSIEIARRERTERTVTELRSEVDRLSKLLESATTPEDVVPLRHAA
jgi:DNA repair exonuclease SbcCD ATPase subunit